MSLIGRTSSIFAALLPALVFFSPSGLTPARADITATGAVDPDPSADSERDLRGTDFGIGRDAAGSVVVDQGSRLFSSNAYLGALSGGSGLMTVAGPGSAWQLHPVNASDRLMLGGQGSGTLAVRGGARVLLSGMSNPFGLVLVNVGEQTSGDGALTVSGENSLFSLDGAESYLYVGRDGASGALTVDGRAALGVSSDEAGALLQFGRDGGRGLGSIVDATLDLDSRGFSGLYLGFGDDSEGELSLDRSARVNVRSSGAAGAAVYIGRDGGRGEMSVTGGAGLALVSDDAYVSIGRGAGSVGAVTIDGGELSLGDAGAVGPRGVVEGNFSGVHLAGTGNDAGGVARMTVTGADSRVVVVDGNGGAFFVVGRNGGLAELAVRSGATFSLRGHNGAALDIGVDGTRASAVLDGASVDLAVDAAAEAFQAVLRIGLSRARQGASGSLRLHNGARLDITDPDGEGAAFVGASAGSSGSLSLEGADTRLNASRAVFVGVDEFLNDAGKGMLSLSGNARIRARQVVLGSGAQLTAGGVIEADLINNGGAIVAVAEAQGLPPAPGLAVTGDYVQNAGSLTLTVSGPERVGRLSTSGQLRLNGGRLVVRFSDGYAPVADDRFQLIEAGTETISTLDAGSIEVQGLRAGFRFSARFAPDGGLSLTADNDGVSAADEIFSDGFDVAP